MTVAKTPRLAREKTWRRNLNLGNISQHFDILSRLRNLDAILTLVEQRRGLEPLLIEFVKVPYILYPQLGASMDRQPRLFKTWPAQTITSLCQQPLSDSPSHPPSAPSPLSPPPPLLPLQYP